MRKEGGGSGRREEGGRRREERGLVCTTQPIVTSVELAYMSFLACEHFSVMLCATKMHRSTIIVTTKQNIACQPNNRTTLSNPCLGTCSTSG